MKITVEEAMKTLTEKQRRARLPVDDGLELISLGSKNADDGSKAEKEGEQ